MYKAKPKGPLGNESPPGQIGERIRRFATALILFHHAIAERIGVGPTDLQCLDLLRERGSMTGSELAAVTGLTTGAITGVVARLERARFLRRQKDRHDGRKQILSPLQKPKHTLHAVFEPIREEMGMRFANLDRRERALIVKFLEGSTDIVYRQAALLRLHARSLGRRSRGSLDL